MGRPKKPPGEARGNGLRVRFTEAERAEIDAAASRAGQDISDWVRAVLLGAAREIRPPVAAKSKPRQARGGKNGSGQP